MKHTFILVFAVGVLKATTPEDQPQDSATFTYPAFVTDTETMLADVKVHYVAAENGDDNTIVVSTVGEFSENNTFQVCKAHEVIEDNKTLTCEIGKMNSGDQADLYVGVEFQYGATAIEVHSSQDGGAVQTKWQSNYPTYPVTVKTNGSVVEVSYV
jgi:hypothetical protein